jgi:hypothetical protein
MRGNSNIENILADLLETAAAGCLTVFQMLPGSSEVNTTSVSFSID